MKPDAVSGPMTASEQCDHPRRPFDRSGPDLPLDGEGLFDYIAGLDI